MLRLKTETCALLISVAALSGQSAIQKVAGVKLHSRFRGQYFHGAPARGFKDHSNSPQNSGPPVQHKVVIVSLAKLELFVVLVNATANLLLVAEIEWSGADTLELAGWNRSGISRSKPARINPQLMLQ